MLEQISDFILNNYIQWLILSLLSICTMAYRRLIKIMENDRAKNKAVAQGVESLLRDRIIDTYHKYEKVGICPIYAKENIKRLYVPYHKLGGNDVATELVEKLLEMPTINN